MNQKYLHELLQAIDRDGPAIVAFITRAYQMEWPQRPYRAHLVAYSSWHGAFSITDSVLILSTNSNQANDRWYRWRVCFTKVSTSGIPRSVGCCGRKRRSTV